MNWIGFTAADFPSQWTSVKALDKAAGVDRQVVSIDESRRRPNRKYKSGAIGNIGGHDHVSDRTDNGATITAPATALAEQWAGWGTALKPAREPIVMARKPLAGTVAHNIETHGTGGINIDACRIGPRERTDYGLSTAVRSQGSVYGTPSESADFDSSKGRFPANLILDPDAAVELDAQSGITTSGAMKREVPAYDGESVTQFLRGRSGPSNQHGDTGGASRFFYVAKTSTKERNAGCEHLPEQNNHPTVKPIALMRYLVRLVTPPGGTVLDRLRVCARRHKIHRHGNDLESCVHCQLPSCLLAYTKRLCPLFARISLRLGHHVSR